MVKSIMIQGTGSHVGKSIITAAICRIFKEEGFRVAPFKSQNMALNSFVTKDGGEMGRAQVVQAEAAGIEPSVDMNPILLKPTGQATSQVIVLGKPIGNLSARDYHETWTKTAMPIIMDAWTRLTDQYEMIIIEGAGSPAEINLKDSEVVNMRIAKATKSPVILVGDIDRGGVLASLVGTLELMDQDERDLVAGFIINKFRGDVSLFEPAIKFLEEKTGKPVLGVVPYYQDFKVQEEDSVATEFKTRQGLERSMEKVDVAVVRLPHMSNFTDFDALEDEPDVHLRYVHKGQSIGEPDLVIIPGSKNTINDLVYLNTSGLAQEIKKLAENDVPVIGICGGFQMLGKVLKDPQQNEDNVPHLKGMGLLDIETVFEPEKVTCQVEGEIWTDHWFFENLKGTKVTGYEIHMGRSFLGYNSQPAFKLNVRSGEKVEILDGALSSKGKVLGTYLHGIFDNDSWRYSLINQLRLRKGLPGREKLMPLQVWEQREKDYRKLASHVRGSINMNLLRDIIFTPKE